MVHDLQKLIAALQRNYAEPPAQAEAEWDSPALNVIDCVLSLNRHYERFVRPRVKKFQKDRPEVRSLQQLRDAINASPSPRDYSVANLDYNDAARAQVLSEVVDYLLDVQTDFEGATERERLEQWAKDARPGDFAFTGIKGFGLAGFQYARILFGANTSKPDVHIQSFVSEAVGRKVSDIEALYLLQRAAARLDYSLKDLDHALWKARSGSAGGDDHSGPIDRPQEGRT